MKGESETASERMMDDIQLCTWGYNICIGIEHCLHDALNVNIYEFN